MISLSLSFSLCVHVNSSTPTHQPTGNKKDRHRSTMKMFAKILEMQHEGLILKRLDTPYVMGEGMYCV